MDAVLVGYIGIAVLILALILRVPVAFSMILVGLAGSLYLLPPEAAFRLVVSDIFDKLGSYSLSVMPMFLLMGFFAAATGITQRLFKVTYDWIGWVRGGVAQATVIACALFSAVCGSSPATAAAIGAVAQPEMKKYKYDDKLAVGCIAGAGSLGPLIPPSGGMIIYGIITEQSIAQLFMAGILPGIMLTILFCLATYILCRRNPSLGPAGPKTTWKQKINSLPGILEAVFIFGLSVGGMFAGLFTPTQAGGVGAVAALIVGVVRRSITWRKIWDATMETIKVSCMILLLITGAVVFGHFLSVSTMPIALIEWIEGLSLHPMVVMAFVCLFYFVGGMFMDALGLMVFSLPIIYPLVASLGFDLVWFGVISTVLGETGVITPPVGVNVYVLKGLMPDVPLEDMFKGIIPYLICIIVALAILQMVPEIALFLPSFIK